jgi:hypothetical protein
MNDMDKKKPNEELYRSHIPPEELVKEPKPIRTIEEILAAKKQLEKAAESPIQSEYPNKTQTIKTDDTPFKDKYPIPIDQIVNFYYIMKQALLMEGFGPTIQKIQVLAPNLITEESFCTIYAKIILQTPQKNKATEELLQLYNREGIKGLPSGKKRDAIEYLHDNSNLIFNQLLHSDDPLKYLETLPLLKGDTKYTLARNIGLDYAAISPGLKKFAEKMGYFDIQMFAQEIANQTGDRVGVVSLIIEKFGEIKKKEFTKLLKNIEK